MPQIPDLPSATTPLDGTEIVPLVQGGVAKQAALIDAMGSKWYTGAGAPSNLDGVNGDFYLRSSNDDVYTKAAGTWSVTGNLRGAAGTNGTNGTNGANGSDGASAQIAYIAANVGLSDIFYSAHIGRAGSDSFTTLSGLSTLIVGASWVAPRSGTLAKIAARIAVGTAGGKARVGIYEQVSTSDGRPSTLIYGSSEITATGASNFSEAATGTIVAGRRYWLVARANDNAVSFLAMSPAVLDAAFGVAGAASTMYSRWGVSGTQAYAAMPGSFPTVTIIDEDGISSGTQASAPYVAVSYAT